MYDKQGGIAINFFIGWGRGGSMRNTSFHESGNYTYRSCILIQLSFPVEKGEWVGVGCETSMGVEASHR